MQFQDATILLVDDEPDLLDIMAEWFHREGARVFVAQHGGEALNLIQQNQVDAVVSDIRMPVMDGLALLRHLKSVHASKPSVIFISGFSDIEPRDAYDLGVEAIMSKPVERKELISVVARILTARNDLWCSPLPDNPQALLVSSFASLAAARAQGHFAFGRGGFCIHSTLLLAAGPIELLLDFQADHRKVLGQGIVRWADFAEAQLGVEITYIDDATRPWLLSLIESLDSPSFIPRTARIQTSRVRSAPL